MDQDTGSENALAGEFGIDVERVQMVIAIGHVKQIEGEGGVLTREPITPEEIQLSEGTVRQRG
jgi:hypothetical protein